MQRWSVPKNPINRTAQSDCVRKNHFLSPPDLRQSIYTEVYFFFICVSVCSPSGTKKKGKYLGTTTFQCWTLFLRSIINIFLFRTTLAHSLALIDVGIFTPEGGFVPMEKGGNLPLTMLAPANRGNQNKNSKYLLNDVCFSVCVSYRDDGLLRWCGSFTHTPTREIERRQHRGKPNN